MRNKGSLGKLLGFLFIFVVTFSSLVLVLNLPYNHRNHIKEKNFCLTKNKVKRLSSQNKLSYEERLISPLEEKNKKKLILLYCSQFLFHPFLKTVFII